MRYFVLATDYDGTLAHDGRVAEETVTALERLRESDRRVILVTGRTLEDLFEIFPRLELFDRVVAENGAVVYRPEEKAELHIAERPPDAFIEALRARGVSPLRVGRVILDTWETERDKVLDAVHEHGLELQLIFNKGSLMVLPSGINKAVGLKTALDEIRLSPRNAVAVGDAENDLALLKAAECAVAVANALGTVKHAADLVTEGDHGIGVQELIDGLVDNDLAHRVHRHDIAIGRKIGKKIGESDQEEVKLPVYGRSVLLTGSSGGGKSSLTTGVIERLMDAGYQVCVIDPEGDYQELGDALLLGGKDHAPEADELLDALKNPASSVVLNLIGVPGDNRPDYFKTLLPRLLELRAKTGRPHWIIVDEAHHVMPSSGDTSHMLVPEHVGSMMLITTDPKHVTETLIAKIEMLLVVGDEPGELVGNFCSASGWSCPDLPDVKMVKGQAMLLTRDAEPVVFKVAECRTPRIRHSRKYAAGEIEPERSFYFRGPHGQLNLRAQNLKTFVQLASGVDEDTWRYHRDRGDYSRWFRDVIRSEELADDTVEIEGKKDVPQHDAVEEIRLAIEKRFTLPG